MRLQRFQRSIRFSEAEWNAVTEAAERNEMTPASFVREATARAAADELDVAEARLTPELIELIKRTFRGVHVLALLKYDEVDEEEFSKVAEAARTLQAKILKQEKPTPPD